MQSNSKVLRIRFQGENRPKQWKEFVDSALKEVLEGFYEKLPSGDEVVKARLVLSNMNEVGITLGQAVEVLDRLTDDGLDVCVDIFRADKEIASKEAELETARTRHQGIGKRIFLSGWKREELAKMIDYTQYSRFVANTDMKGIYSFDYEASQKPSWKKCGCGDQA